MQTTIQSSDYYSILLIPPLEIKWNVLINDIRRKGFTYQQQYDILGKPQSTFSQWISGSDPRFSSGCALLILHQKVCGEELTRKRIAEAHLDLPPTIT